MDPRTSNWLSTDPILGDYLKRGASGASPSNLSLYSYASNNPFVVKDPDGRETWSLRPQIELDRVNQIKFETAVQQGADKAVELGYRNPARIAAYATLSAEGGDTRWPSVDARAKVIGPQLVTGGGSTLTTGVKIVDTSGGWEFVSQTITFGALGVVANEALGALAGGGAEAAPLGRGFTAKLAKGTRLPASFDEQIAIQQAMSHPEAGIRTGVKMTDPRWLGSEGWVKMQQMVKFGSEGRSVNVHYVFNPTTGAIDDFKIVMPGARP
jgi:hypothetical protein